MILSIESSCDDSSIAVTEIESRRLLLHKKISQEKEHSLYGGVVPELASRLHAVALPKLLEEAKPYFSSLKAVAVTNRPGLGVTLMEGIAMAKTVAVLLEIPIIDVHHLKGHVYSLFIEKPSHFPLLILLVSGGHTMVLRANSFEQMEILATSIDDSVGESFDKTAKMMGLGYPGGPVIEALAKEGDPERFALPVPLRNDKRIAFSLSGLKNAVRLTVESLGGADAMSHKDKCDLAASFQATVIKHLLQKTKKIFKTDTTKDFAIVGGASANLAIREAFGELCADFGKTMLLAPLEYCSDNAAMIGRYGIDAYLRNQFADIDTLDAVVTRKLQSGTLLE